MEVKVVTQAQLYQALQSIGLPIAYHHFTTPPNPPYLVYLFNFSADMIADNQNYVEISNFQVELYNTKKDPVTEKRVEDKLKELELPYTKTETFIESEGLFQALYLIQVIGG
jgi:hypothetical protein